MDQENKELVAVGKKTKRKSILGIMFEDIIIKNFNDIKNTFVDEVLIPQTMDWLYDLGTDFLSGILQSSSSSYKRRDSAFSRNIDYTSRFRNSVHGKRERRDERTEEVGDYRDISFDTRDAAENVLSKMINNINRYDGTVTVRDLLSFTGFKTNYTDEKYGWTDLSKARVFRQNGRYYLDLPEPLVIEND